MRIEELDLNIGAFVAAPPVRDAPAPDWSIARESGVLPTTLFSLYIHSNYLSFGGAPPFLDDHDRVLFSYFGIALQSIKDALSEADSELRTFLSKQGQGYTPEKRLKGEPWEQDADAAAKRSFKLLLSSLLASLDSTAELVALFLPNAINGLRVGRAQFSAIESWLAGPAPALRIVCTPQEKKMEELYWKIKPAICTAGEEREWLRFARLLRNKSTHISNSIFQFSFQHPDGTRYTFLQREWPPILQKYMHAPDTAPPAGFTSMPDLLKSILLHQDIASYATDLRDRVTGVVDDIAGIVDEMYLEFGQFPMNQAALDELATNSEVAAFESFQSKDN